MTSLTTDRVVLRDTVFVPGAVRVPRAPPAAKTLASPPALFQETPSPDEGYREGLRLGREEGLRSGREEGRRDGHAEGLRQGAEAAQEQARSALAAAILEATLPLEERARDLATVLAAMNEAVAQVRAGAEDETVTLCYEVLCRIVGEAVITPQGVRRQVERLLAASDARSPVTLRLHPADLRAIEEATQATPPASAAGQPVLWIADAQVVLGGCIVTTAGGGLDARLETVLETCKAGLLQARAKARVLQVAAGPCP